MNASPTLRCLLIRLFAALIALCSCAALAQADPPGRVGRLNYSHGSVSFSPSGDNEWTEAQPNRPLTKGDRLWTDRGSRAEIQIGSSAVRLAGQARLEIIALNDQATQLSLTQGSLYLRVRSLPDGENFEIDTPNLAYRAAYPGDYRIDVDAGDGTTRVTIHSGTGAVYGEGGNAMPLGAGQQITFRTRSLTQVATQESPPQDAFDRWAAERNRQEDQSIAARYVPREVVGYQQLDAHGQWKKDPTHGAIWVPQGTPANWAPYRNGRWDWVDPWGWTWIDDAPWGFAPFHYGRWALVESRWAWVPGQLGLRPVYAPALAAFVGNASGGFLASLTGRSGVAWFPLAPGEMWQPAFRASGAYISNVNRNMAPGSSDTPYAYQRRPEALTAISGDDFQRGRPAGASWLRVAGDTLTNAALVPPPPRPDRTALAQAGTARPAPAPAQAQVQQVNASQGAVAATPSSQRERNATQRAEQAKASEQAKVAEQSRLAEQAEAARQTKATEQAKQAQQVQQAQALAQAKAAERARAAEQAQVAAKAVAKAAEEVRAAEQARAAALARAAEQARQEKLAAQEQARAAQQAKLEQQRKASDPARVAAQTKATERTRRAEAARAEVPVQQARQSNHTQRREAAARELASAKNQQARVSPRNRQMQAAARADAALREQSAQREQQARRAEVARQEAQARQNERALAKARSEEKQRMAALARENEQLQRIAHSQRVEQARRSAERDAQILREQRAEREAQARREADEQAQRQAEQRQAAAEQLRRDQQARQEQQQLERARSRPDLRDPRYRPPEVWQRGIPILNSGRTS